MIVNIDDLDYIITDTELEALLLENKLIKRYKPRYNTLLKNYKNYPYIKINLKDKFPKLEIAKDIKDDNAKYFGPYTRNSCVYEAIECLKEIFPIRRCNKKFTKTSEPCLNFHLKKCLGPCYGKVSQNEYFQLINKIIMFLKGKNCNVIKEIEKKMHKEAEKKNFEKALKLKNQIKSLRHIINKQKAVNLALLDYDIIAFIEREDGFINILFVRWGQMLGKFSTNIYDYNKKEIERFIKKYYATDWIRKKHKLVLQEKIDEIQIIESYLSLNKINNIKIKHKINRNIVDEATDKIINSLNRFKKFKASL
ncbi:UvrB/UvrC motif-containing protein [Thermohalobacter berrensis]|uniref:Excinuclease ABC subunit C n=1 Tax=Thermohalobacter berrensis TaxID=99594 RepID=A0A419SV78_9FIRM|nr:UvrB/UvrC motif-containing protein [Thermohalobacter berrensis]RKD29126.1 hypothetical protein BET03_06150 [Thermohalobacter berrensis]